MLQFAKFDHLACRKGLRLLGLRRGAILILVSSINSLSTVTHNVLH